MTGVKEMTGVKGVNGGKVAVAEAPEAEEEEAETDPNLLQKSWMPSWMLTMPWYVPVKSFIYSILSSAVEI